MLVYLWPVLIGGKILSPIADLYAFTPWRGMAPPDLQRYVNPVLSDLPRVDFPWRFLTRQQLHEGVLPAWNPFVLAGSPFYNPQSGLFSPFSIPMWILPLNYGAGVAAALKLLAGGLGTYALVRQLRLGFLPGLLAGIAFAFAAVNIVWLAHDTLPAVAVMVPWALLLVERIFERGRLGSALALAAAIAVGLGGGHPGMQVHLLVVTCAYAVARAAFTPRRDRLRAPQEAAPGPLRALGLVAASLAAGALLMAFMLVPELRSAHDTVGVSARRAQDLPGAHLPLAAIKTVLFPDWWGRPSAAEPPLNDSNFQALVVNYCERTFYAGAVALVLAGVGLCSRGAWRRKAPFVLIGVLGLATALRAPGLHWLATHLPILASVEAQRLHFAFALACAVLAAYGLQALLDGAVALRVAIAATVAVVALAGAASLTVGFDGSGVHDTVEHFLHGTEIAEQHVLAFTSIVWFLLFAGGACIALLIARRHPRRRVAIAAAVVLLAAGDAYHFAGDFQPMGPASRVIPPITPALAFLIAHRDDGRIVGLRDALPNDWPLVYGLRDVRGYDPPQPTRRMLALWQTMTPEQLGWTPLTLNDLTPRDARVLGVLGVRYVIADPGTAVPVASRRLLRTVYAGADATVIESSATAPRAFVPTDVTLTTTEDEARSRMVDPGFDPRRAVTASRAESGPRSPAGSGTVSILQDDDARVVLRATLARRGLVVLDDQLTDGWSVRVDGRPTDPLHVDSVMRGVIVPRGSHTVTWSYAIPGLRLGAALSLSALLALAAAAGVLGVRGRRALKSGGSARGYG